MHFNNWRPGNVNSWKSGRQRENSCSYGLECTITRRRSFQVPDNLAAVIHDCERSTHSWRYDAVIGNMEVNLTTSLVMDPGAAEHH